MSEDSPFQRRSAATPTTIAPTRKQQKAKEELLKDTSSKVISAKTAIERLTVAGYWPTDNNGPMLSTLAHTLLLVAHTGKLSEMREVTRAVAFLLDEEATSRLAAPILQSEITERDAAGVLSQAAEKIHSNIDTALVKLNDAINKRAQQLKDNIHEVATSIQSAAAQIRTNQPASSPSSHVNNMFATSAPIHPSRQYPPTQFSTPPS